MKIFRRSVSQRGDTIVEVIISVAILSTALTIAYSLGSAALHNSESANHRTEALAIANSQIELIKNVIASGNITPYEVQNKKFCITYDAVRHTGWNSYCKGFNGTIYNLTDTYTANPSYRQVFDINVQWPDPKAAKGTANLDIYYRL